MNTKIFDAYQIRNDFPILQQQIHGKPLIYLDNAATSQKPLSVIETIDNYYKYDNSNVHRGVHTLSERATHHYENTRIKIQNYINAKATEEIIFTSGTTSAINLVAQSFARPRLKIGDEILISYMEHHSNIVPWQLVCEQTGASLKVAPINEHGELLIEELIKLINPKTKLIALVHMSNSLGTINPVETIIKHAHQAGVPVLLDGAQATAHMRIDVQTLDCDFYAFSSHKMFGPTGTGVLYGKTKWLDAMPPYQGGGDMISTVSFNKSTYRELPHKFEAGTPNISAVIGLGAAIDYLQQLDTNAVQQYEAELLAYGTQQLQAIPDLKLIGTAKHKAAILAFVLTDIHPHDIGTILDHEGIAVRTGHHCTMPLMDFFQVPATVRASLAFYNTKEDLDALIHGIKKVREVFK
jgi:cysteine desulfurase/selenocysteine lyase